MKQLNVNITKEFERDLKFVMKNEKITGKSDAVRHAVHELAERARRRKSGLDALRGAALLFPPNPNPKFRDEDDLWS